MNEHRVDVQEDEDGGRARAECRECCWAVSGQDYKVYQMADQHEREHEAEPPL